MPTVTMTPAHAHPTIDPAAEYSRRLRAWADLGSFARGESQSLSTEAAALVRGTDLSTSKNRTALERWALVFARALEEFSLLSDEIVQSWSTLDAQDLMKIDDAIRSVDTGLNLWLPRVAAAPA